VMADVDSEQRILSERAIPITDRVIGELEVLRKGKTLSSEGALGGERRILFE
jgi:hypothetical protein